MMRGRVRKGVAGVLGAVLPLIVAADVSAGSAIADALRRPVLRETEAGGPHRLALYYALSNDMARAARRSRENYAALGDRRTFGAWREQMRAACSGALGGYPGRTPLNARVTGEIRTGVCRVEKVVFESQPGLHVTALLFLPLPERHAPPYPGVLVPCGHSKEGKAAVKYQNGAALAAANGMAALVYDPLEQGERLQGSVANLGRGHNHIHVPATLLGWSTARFMVWDGMRALDYLASRPEVDKTRLGCMGNSGGGTLTTFLAALDERITAASPSCYITSMQALLERRGPPDGPNLGFGPPDAEQNLYGQMAFGLEHAGWLLMRAVRPTCVCAAQQDFNPIHVTRETVGQVCAVYAALGAAERITLEEYAGPHTWAPPLREAAVRWMVRWLSPGARFAMCPDTHLSVREAQVTETGAVLTLPGAKSVYDLMRARAAEAAAARVRLTESALAEAVRRKAGVRRLADIPALRVCERETGETEHGVRISRLVLWRDARYPLPAVFLRPSGPARGTPVLLAHGQGKGQAAAEAARLARAEGRAVLALDLSGVGETEGERYGVWSAGITWDEGPAMMAYLLGRSLVGIRTEDLLAAARYLGETCGNGPVALHASSWAVTPALHAAVAEPARFGAVRLTDAPPAWETVVAKGLRHRFSDVVFGALGKYTTGDLLREAERCGE